MSHPYTKANQKHAEWKGKIATVVKAPIETKEDLQIAYTPGVAGPCLEIHRDARNVYDYTWKGNTVAVITDGSAVLGLGDIGPHASLPVMEGKCALFKRFANIDAIPIALDTHDTQDIIRICQALAPSFGGFNLEDISAPRCVEIERALKKTLSIPVFHDDQHGTAMVVCAALSNALKLVNKSFESIRVVLSGAGAAGSAIIFMLKALGVQDILAFDQEGILTAEDAAHYDFLKQELAQIVNTQRQRLSFAAAFDGADVFIGVSAGNLVRAEMIQAMNRDPVVFALANPEPEITYAQARAAGARVVGTGRSDAPNQINNVLAFPGLFKGALAARATTINETMTLAAVHAIASLIPREDLTEETIIPSVFDERLVDAVAQAVQDAVRQTGGTRDR